MREIHSKLIICILKSLSHQPNELCSKVWYVLDDGIDAGGTTCLVEALLEELPEQFLSYMRNRDIKPIPLHIKAPHCKTKF